MRLLLRDQHLQERPSSREYEASIVGWTVFDVSRHMEINHATISKKERETMQHNLIIKRIIVIASLALITLILPGVALATEQVTKSMSSAEAQTHNLAQIAVGSVSDTLELCLGRIPLDASAGQLMLAEQNCQHVEAGRTVHQASLTF